MPTVLPMTRVEAYLAYKAGVIAESDLKPSLKTNFYSGLEHWLAYWCGLTADYPKDKNNDPKWYTEEEYYVAYLCGIAPDYPVNCYRRVGAYLRYIISARWGRPEKPLTREEYYLSLMSAPYLPPNEPASIISIEDTAEAPFGDLKIYGDSFQQAYEGKNLLPISLASPAGLTVSYDSANGELSVVGTPTADWVAITVYSPISIAQGTTITASKEVEVISGSTPSSTVVRLRDSTNDVTDDITASGAEPTKTMTKNITRTQIYQRFTAGDSYNYKMKVQIEVGSTATTFEPYVGGIPAPNPDYPQDIQVVTGEQTVQVIGKNFANIALANLEQVYITQGGERSSSGNSCTTISPIEVIAGQTFVCSYEEKTANSFLNYGHFFDNDDNYVGRTDPAIKHTPFTVPAGATKMYLTFYHNGGLPIASFGDYLANVQLELGSTASDYVPYQSQSYSINLGKNIFSGVIEAGGYDNNDGVTKLSNVNQCRNDSPIAVLPNTEYVFGVDSSLYTKNVRIFFLNSSKVMLSTEVINGHFTTPANCAYINWHSSSLRSDYPNFDPELQIELGTVATAYAPYFTPIELAKIGTYQDYLWTDGKKWWKRKAISTYNFANFTYTSATTKQAYGYVVGTSVNPLVGAVNPLVGLCSHFAIESTNTTWTGLNKTGVNAVNSLWFQTTAESGGDTRTAEQFVDWASANNLTFYYALATPTDEEITNETLISQLNALLEGGSYNYQTNIVVSAADPNLPGLLQVTAAKY